MQRMNILNNTHLKRSTVKYELGPFSISWHCVILLQLHFVSPTMEHFTSRAKLPKAFLMSPRMFEYVLPPNLTYDRRWWLLWHIWIQAWQTYFSVLKELQNPDNGSCTCCCSKGSNVVPVKWDVDGERRWFESHLNASNLIVLWHFTNFGTISVEWKIILFE